MESNLNLIKSDQKSIEKRVFPRFPFTYLTFKEGSEEEHVFEVINISYSGMGLALKEGGTKHRIGDHIEGNLHWKGISVTIEGVVRWIEGASLGVSFTEDIAFIEKIRNFLSIENFISSMRPIHKSELDVELPSNLKYWLQADGPVEIFVWRHNDGEISKIHIILMDSFVEWEDGKGINTGRILSKRRLDTPLDSKDEFEFELDNTVDNEKMSFAQNIIDKLPKAFLPPHALEFLQLKIGQPAPA